MFFAVILQEFFSYICTMEVQRIELKIIFQHMCDGGFALRIAI